MRTFLAFFKKEWVEQLRTGRLLILGIIFMLFGIMNPAITLITPWMMDALSDSLAQSGMTISNIPADALVSWGQFYKNIPIALLVFVLMLSSCLTGEYRRKTLIPVLTKGLSRYKVICSKAFVMLLMWTVGFAISFFITLGYNAYYWDNSIVLNLWTAAAAYYVFGIWAVSLVTVFSAVFSSNIGVLLGTGGAVIASLILSALPKVQSFVPNYLSDSGVAMLTGSLQPADFTWAFVITGVLTVAAFVLSVLLFNKRSVTQ